MPPRARRAARDSLTPENLETLAAAVAQGRRATVYMREATPSLGLPEGTSAKVVSVDGSTVTISPKGVDDELPFEADELRMTRAPATPPAAKTPSAAKTPPAAKATAPKKAPAPQIAPKAVETKTVEPKAGESQAPSPRGSAPVSKPATRRAKKGPEGVSVTIHCGADNDWSVTVTHAAKRPSKAQPVSPEAVGRAVRELGDPTARDAVEAVISHAREEAARRVAELSRELEEARTTLAALEHEV